MIDDTEARPVVTNGNGSSNGNGAQPSKLRRVGSTIAGVLLVPVLPFALIFAGIYSVVGNAPANLHRIGGRLNTAAGFRDGFLVLVALSYAVGYAVWSLHAWQDDLGLLPALRFQYIFAGLFPLAFAWAVFHILRGFAYIARLGTPAAIVVSLLMIGGSIALSVFLLPSFVGRWGLVAYLVVTLLLFLSGPMFGAIGLLRFAIPWVGLTAIGVATALYITVVYPEIPQEFGGVKPKCARLEVKRAELSADGRQHLIDAKTKDAVVRTRPVSLLFTTNDFSIVRRRTEDTSPTYRLGSETVLSTVGC